MFTFNTMLDWVRKAAFHTLRSQRDTLLTATGAKRAPAQADKYSDCKGRFFSEPHAYQIQAFLSIQQVGE